MARRATGEAPALEGGNLPIPTEGTPAALPAPGSTDTKVGYPTSSPADSPAGMGFKGYTENMTPAEIKAHNQGLEWAARAEGEFTPFTNPALFRWQISKPLTQFKGYQKFALDDIFAPRAGDTPDMYWDRVAKKLLVIGATGGAKALAAPGGTLTKGLVAWWAYNTINKLSAELQERNPEMSKAEAEDWATQTTNAIVYGFPGMVGIDFSASTSLFDLYGRTPDEQLLNYFGGPFLGTVSDFGKLMGGLLSDPAKAIGGFISDQTSIGKGVSKINNADGSARKQRRPTVTDAVVNRNITESTDFEKTLAGLGYSTIKQSSEYDKKDASYVEGLGKKIRKGVKGITKRK